MVSNITTPSPSLISSKGGNSPPRRKHSVNQNRKKSMSDPRDVKEIQPSSELHKSNKAQDIYLKLMSDSHPKTLHKIETSPRFNNCKRITEPKKAAELDLELIERLHNSYDLLSNIPCTPALIDKVGNEIIEKAIEKKTRKNKTLYNIKAILDNHLLEPDSQGSYLSKKIQKKLLSNSSIPARIKFIDQCFLDWLEYHQNKTPFMETLHQILQELADLNLNSFIPGLNNIKKHVYKTTNYSIEETHHKEILKKLKPIVFMALGDSKNERAEVFETLKGWDSKSLQELESTATRLTTKYIERQNLSCIEYRFSEIVKNSLLLLPSIDSTSLKEMKEILFRDGVSPGTISINKNPFQLPNDSNRLESEYYYKFFALLYEELGFEILPTLKNEVEALCSKNDAYDYSDETLLCFRLLKMVCMASWGRADWLIKQGLADLLTGQFALTPRETKDEVIYKFNVNKNDPKKIHVEIIKIYKISSSLDFREVKSIFPVSWKVYLPKKEPHENELKWNYRLRLLRASIDVSVKPLIRENIENHYIHLMPNSSREVLAKYEIMVTRKIVNSLIPKAEGIEILSIPKVEGPETLPLPKNEEIISSPRKSPRRQLQSQTFTTPF